jgi:DegV family protein with EDD domain
VPIAARSEGTVTGVRIVTDSACDLPANLAQDQRIEIVPLTIRFGDQEFVDREDLSPREFWARCQASPTLPETAAPAPGMFEERFRKLAAEGATGIACVCISSKLSATMQAAELAARAVADELPVRVVDSLSASIGEGLITLVAADAAAGGASLDDVVTAATDVVPRTRVYGALDTLENLKKGGRIGGARAMIGSMLSIKPVIQVVDGVVEEESKQRTRSRSIAHLVSRVREQGRVDRLAVMHAEAPDVDSVVDQLDALHPRDEIIVTNIGAVIGTHAGPRSIGVSFVVSR